jgi:hypothetical protein
MSILVETPQTEVFSALPDFHDALTNFQEKQVQNILHKLGNIFVRHGAYQDFGLSMNHRHFDMNSDEILVQTIDQNKTKSLSFPWVVNGNNAKPSNKQFFESNGFPENSLRKYIVPNNWCFDKNGNAVAFEFLATDNDDQAILPKLKAEFVQELFTALKQLGIEQYVGIRRSTDIRDTAAWETTAKGKRVNVVVFGDMPEGIKSEEMKKVAWTFNADGNISQDGLHCVGHQHCYSHGDDDSDDD